jgi:hypothetical protein
MVKFPVSLYESCDGSEGLTDWNPTGWLEVSGGDERVGGVIN